MRSKLWAGVSVVLLLLSLNIAAWAAPVEITFASFLSASDGSVMEQLVNQFNAEQDQIRVVYTAWGGDFWDKLAVSIAAGTPPEVAIDREVNIIDWNRKDMLEEFSESDLNDMGLSQDDYFEAVWAQGTQQGRCHAIPLDIHPYGLYINLDIFEASGIVPDIPDEREAILSLVRKLTIDENGDGEPDQTGMQSGSKGSHPRAWFSFLHQLGGRILENETVVLTKYRDAALQALQFQLDVKEARMNRSLSFENGVVAMLMDGTWVATWFEKKGLNFKTAPIPQIGSKRAVWSGGHLLMMPKGVKENDPRKYEAAKVFLGWLATHDLLWAKETGHLPVRVSSVQSDVFQALQYQRPFAEQLAYAVTWPAPGVYGAVAEPFYELFFGTSGISPIETLHRMEKAVQQVLAQ